MYTVVIFQNVTEIITCHRLQTEEDGNVNKTYVDVYINNLATDKRTSKIP